MTLAATNAPDKSYLKLIRRWPPHPIRDDADYDAAVAVMYDLTDRAERGLTLTDGEEQYLAVLDLLVEAYDDEHHPPPPKGTVPERLRALMGFAEVNQARLAEIAGASRGNVSEVLSGKRELSKAQIRRLAAHFKLSADYFL